MRFRFLASSRLCRGILLYQGKTMPLPELQIPALRIRKILRHVRLDDTPAPRRSFLNPFHFFTALSKKDLNDNKDNKDKRDLWVP